MRESKYTSYDALPLTLTAPEVGEVLGISRAAAYELVRSHGFLRIKIGTRIKACARQSPAHAYEYHAKSSRFLI